MAQRPQSPHHDPAAAAATMAAALFTLETPIAAVNTRAMYADLCTVTHLVEGTAYTAYRNPTTAEVAAATTTHLNRNLWKQTGDGRITPTAPPHLDDNPHRLAAALVEAAAADPQRPPHQFTNPDALWPDEWAYTALALDDYLAAMQQLPEDVYLDWAAIVGPHAPAPDAVQPHELRAATRTARGAAWAAMRHHATATARQANHCIILPNGAHRCLKANLVVDHYLRPWAAVAGKPTPTAADDLERILPIRARHHLRPGRIPPSSEVVDLNPRRILNRWAAA